MVDQRLVDARLIETIKALRELGVGILLIDSAGNVIGDISLSALRDALKPTRAAPEQVLSGQSIAGGETAEFVVSGADGYSAVVVTVKATYDILGSSRNSQGDLRCLCDSGCESEMVIFT